MWGSVTARITAALGTKILQRSLQAAECFLSQDEPQLALVPPDLGSARTDFQGHVPMAGVHRDFVFVVVDRDLDEIGHAWKLPASEAAHAALGQAIGREVPPSGPDASRPHWLYPCSEGR